MTEPHDSEPGGLLHRTLLRHSVLFNAAVFWGARFKQMLSPFRIRQYLKKQPLRKLQFGSGKNILSGWLNTEILPYPGTVYMDLLKKLPFGENTFNYIYTEHVISSFEYEQALRWMKECHRILKPGGKIRIATPDLRFFGKGTVPDRGTGSKKILDERKGVKRQVASCLILFEIQET